MSSNILENYYDPLLQQNNFIPVKCPEKFSPAGSVQSSMISYRKLKK